ncbi:hypothetical protein J2S74_002210 [Evansella vedderi]|uniref:Uncharacterized protein n=1 Tax=Evansella vedderi TaxID=38282 RepID=A0ABT9ZVR9_9BACI|nr:hypothetical protein [Evansella vedderi]
MVERKSSGLKEIGTAIAASLLVEYQELSII